MFVYYPERKDRYRIGGKVHFGGGYVDTLMPDWIADTVAGGSLPSFVERNEGRLRMADR